MYKLAKQGVYRSIQGEGYLCGTPMVFVRLSGCPIGCDGCDTEYDAAETVSVVDIYARISAVREHAEWVAITGGEPAVYRLWSLLDTARMFGHVMLSTSGHFCLAGAGRLVDFLSVSPHGTPEALVIRSGSQINLVPGLNGMRMEDWNDFDASGFNYKYATPLCSQNGIDETSLGQCIDFVMRHNGWRLGTQAHKAWGLA